MKHRLTLFASVITVVVAAVVSAQSNDDDVQLTRAAIQAQRQEIVAANLGLNGEESAVFWPLYQEYRDAVGRAINSRVDLLERFADSYETLTDTEAMSLLNDHLAFEKEMLEIQTAYAKKIGKVLPGRTVARFFQIENKMDAIVNYEMAGEIPLVK